MDSIPKIFVLGAENLFNWVFAQLIGDRTAHRCELTGSLEPLLDPTPPAANIRRLLLVNDEEVNLPDVMRRLLPGERRALASFTLALFNVEPEDHDIGHKVAVGVRGVFYRPDRLEHVVRGINCLLRGQVWVPRSVLVEAVLNRSRPDLEAVADSGLTRREIQILSSVSRGATTGEISSRLFISPHTVKTHLYHIYRKTGTSNRLQAARWAIHNLNGWQLPMP